MTKQEQAHATSGSQAHKAERPSRSPRGEARIISLAVDGSRETECAFQWASANMFQPQDTIILIHAYSQQPSNVLDKYRALCQKRGLKSHLVSAQGSPAKVIADVTKSCKCDLAVMGSRGLNAFKRTVMGSVSSKVASVCECPVMVIKKPKHEAGAFLTVIPRRVFFNLEVGQDGLRPLEWASKKLLCAEIDEVFLVASTITNKKSLQEKEEYRIQLELLMDQYESECKSLGIRKIERIRTSGNANEALLKVAEEHSCDVLVSNRAKGSSRNDAGMFSAHNAPFPVIVVPAGKQKKSLRSPSEEINVKVPAELRVVNHKVTEKTTSDFHCVEGPPSPSSRCPSTLRGSSTRLDESLFVTLGRAVSDETAVSAGGALDSTVHSTQSGASTNRKVLGPVESSCTTVCKGSNASLENLLMHLSANDAESSQLSRTRRSHEDSEDSEDEAQEPQGSLPNEDGQEFRNLVLSSEQAFERACSRDRSGHSHTSGSSHSTHLDIPRSPLRRGLSRATSQRSVSCLLSLASQSSCRSRESLSSALGAKQFELNLEEQGAEPLSVPDYLEGSKRLDSLGVTPDETGAWIPIPA